RCASARACRLCEGSDRLPVFPGKPNGPRKSLSCDFLFQFFDGDVAGRFVISVVDSPESLRSSKLLRLQVRVARRTQMTAWFSFMPMARLSEFGLETETDALSCASRQHPGSSGGAEGVRAPHPR